MARTGQKFRKVIREFEQGQLMTKGGKQVTSRKQALAIAFSEQRRANKARRGR